jgi:hypothetical protein
MRPINRKSYGIVNTNPWQEADRIYFQNNPNKEWYCRAIWDGECDEFELRQDADYLDIKSMLHTIDGARCAIAVFKIKDGARVRLPILMSKDGSLDDLVFLDSDGESTSPEEMLVELKKVAASKSREDMLASNPTARDDCGICGTDFVSFDLGWIMEGGPVLVCKRCYVEQREKGRRCVGVSLCMTKETDINNLTPEMRNKLNKSKAYIKKHTHKLS